MPELRRDPITGRWIIINIDNPKGPHQYEVETNVKKGGVCAFCPGNEKMTPPEIISYSKTKRDKDTPGWTLRVVPNKFPALQIEGNLDRVGVGIFDMMNGIGAHEVIIETTSHDKEIADRDEGEIKDLLWSYRDRSLDLRKDRRFKYILIFKNYGFSAGASLEHPHSQLIALPFVPKRVLGEIDGSQKYFNYRERCVYCDMIRQELEEKDLTISENRNFLSFVPFVSRFPYEAWIIPKEHISDFCQIQIEGINDLASILKDTLLRIKSVLRDAPYNFILHTAPLDDLIREDYHWHIEIMPRLTKVAGFEWGTGFYINPTPPELAAKTLREIQI
ncbi:MAG: galactose-1-phosphate uridylyltransferase [Candidatus Omnitrophica bacterium]|nr:galactose-1-phosphate uridylyltransferase [Candidatus Omnitrophota bacterium]